MEAVLSLQMAGEKTFMPSFLLWYIDVFLFSMLVKVNSLSDMESN